MARDGKRNPNSQNQRIMDILFGNKKSKSVSSDWHQWPETQRAIYSRMFSRQYLLISRPEFKKLTAKINKLSKEISKLRDDFDMQSAVTVSSKEFFS